MFDIGFTELLLSVLVGLMVIGPKQLPESIRLVTSWVKSAKQMWHRLKSQIEKELELDDMSLQLQRESVVSQYNSNKSKLKALGDGIQQSNIDLMNTFSFSEEKSSPLKDKVVNTD